MKALFYHLMPFALAPGGLQIQITRTREALQELGVEVEFLRWWDDRQHGEILHFFGRMPSHVLHLAQEKGMKVVQADLLSARGSRLGARLESERVLRRALVRFLPRSMMMAFNWQSYTLADACVALTPWEAHLMRTLFGASAAKMHIIPNGVEEVFLASEPATRGQWLVCSAAITERKRVLELAEAAVAARTPLWLIGKPPSETAAYGQRVLNLAKQHPQLIRYEGAIDDSAKLAQIYRQARGFVLLSFRESLSHSTLAAAACECPLLLSDLPWARTVFGNKASYCPLDKSPSRTAVVLRRFYDATPGLPLPPRPHSWREVGRQVKLLYESLMNGTMKP